MSSHAHLSNGGVDIYLEVIDGALAIRYWGKSVHGDPSKISFARSIPNSDFDEIATPGVMREHSRGWLGYPTIAGHRDGKSWSTKFEVKELKSSKESFTATLKDDSASLQLSITLILDQHGAARIGYQLTNLGERYTLNELAYWLPLSDKAVESLDFVGRWSKERTPQRKSIDIGRWVRESNEGRSGHNFTIGEIALTHETNFGSGEAWSVALAWSGDTRYYLEKNYEGVKSIGASEVLAPGEIIL
ncbi:MAG: glycoside hydrolase family 36 N-terminal domain-containing protein, partial [Actinomycetota bacterium]